MAKSRAERFEQSKNKVSAAKMELEELRDELQDWLDNMPDNLQGGQKAEELDAAIDGLEELICQLEEIEAAEVEFPGMIA